MENQPQMAPSGSKSTIWTIILVVVLIIAGGAYFFLAQDDGTNTNSTNNANAGVNSDVNVNENTNAVLNVNTDVGTTENTNSATNDNVNAETNTNSNVDTSDWKTYIDSTYQFSLRYPASWSVHVYNDGYNDEGSYVIVFTTAQTGSERLPFVVVRDDWSVSDEVARIEAIDPPLSKVTSSRQVQIDPWQATEIIYSTAVGVDFRKLLISYQSRSFVFDSTQSDDDFLTVASTLSFN